MNAVTGAGQRRIVAFRDLDGKSRLYDDDRAPRCDDYASTPGMRTSLLWTTDRSIVPAGRADDPIPGIRTVHPPVGGSTFLMLTLPPDSVYADPGFDGAAAASEQARLVPGIAERMEPDAPGFHTTDTIDYVVLLTGELWLVVDNGEARLTPGDSVVQLGSRHAWQNRSESAATLMVVLMGAERAAAPSGTAGR